MSRHGYMYGSGMAGCLYDNGPHWAANKADAIGDLFHTFSDCFEDEQAAKRFCLVLETLGTYVFLPKKGAGADYAEITEASAEEAAQFQESEEA